MKTKFLAVVCAAAMIISSSILAWAVPDDRVVSVDSKPAVGSVAVQEEDGQIAQLNNSSKESQTTSGQVIAGAKSVAEQNQTTAESALALAIGISFFIAGAGMVILTRKRKR